MPINETPEDREREERAIRLYEEHLRRTVGPVTVHRAVPGGKSPCDAIVEIENYLMFLEVKCRTIASTTYDTYIIDEDKMQNLQFMSIKQTAGLLVHWTDRLGLFIMQGRTRPRDIYVAMAGRNDRGQKNDMEMCWHIPIRLFKTIETSTSALL